MSNIIRTSKSEYDRLRDLRSKLVIVKETRVEDSDRRYSVVVLHLLRFSTAAAVSGSHDARGIDVQAIGSRDSPLNGFRHPVDSCRTTVPARGSGGDGDESVRRNLGGEFCADVPSSLQAPLPQTRTGMGLSGAVEGA